MLEICQNVQKVGCQGAEGKSFFHSFNCLNDVGSLVLINVNVMFLDSTLKRFKDSSGMAIKNTVRTVLRNRSTCTSKK